MIDCFPPRALSSPSSSFPSISILSLSWKELAPTPVGCRDFFSESDQAGTEVAIIRTAASGVAPVSYTEIIHEHDNTIPYARRFMTTLQHGWDAAFLAIINRPTLLDTRYGSLYIPTESGLKIIQETIYVSGIRREQYFSELERLEEFSKVSAENKPSFSQNIFFPVLNIQSGVYFHMMSEALLQAFVIASLSNHRQVVGIAPRARRGVAELAVQEAQRFGLRVVDVNQRFVWLERAAFYSCFQKHARMNPDFRRMTDHFRRTYSGRPLASEIDVWKRPPRTGRRIYVSRITSAARPLENERELIEIAQSHGFEVVDPGTLSFPQQVALFAEASIVLGPHGAGLTNAAFCDPGSTLIEVRALNRASQSPSRNETYRRLAACCGLHYGCLMFENPPASEGWRIDIEAVTKVLERLPPSEAAAERKNE